jgi:DHA2 family multidrug resistance protein
MQMFGQAIQAGSQEFKNVTANLAYFAQQHMGSNMATAALQSKSMIMSHVSKQAYIAGIDDDFWMAAIFTFVGLIPVVIMRTKNKKTIIKA